MTIITDNLPNYLTTDLIIPNWEQQGSTNRSFNNEKGVEKVLTAKETHVPVIANKMKISNHLASVIWGGKTNWWKLQCLDSVGYRYAELSYRVFQLEEEDGSLGPIRGWFDTRSASRLFHRFRFLRLVPCTSLPSPLQNIRSVLESRWEGSRESNLNERADGCIP